MEQTQTRRRPRRQRIVLTPVMWGLLAAFLVMAIITVYLTFATVRMLANKELPVESVPQGAPEAVSPVSLISLLDGDTMLQEKGGLKPEPWDGENRVTVLLMGLDYRDWEADGPSRTDTLMLLTMDAATKTAGILSLPRDLWVNIPGYGYGKINTANYLGDAYDEPGGGPGLAVSTVEEFLGVPINYYAQIDFSAFERFIDELGGIEVDVPQDIQVDPIGPGNTVFLEAGPQTLDGATALAYARNRDTAGSDFDRAARQQQVIMAIRKRILSLDMLPILIKNAPELYNQLASGVHSNLTLKEIMQIAFTASQVPAENIHRRVIGPEHVTFTYSPEGMDILVPDTDAVRQIRDEVFAKTSSVAPAGPTEGVTGDPIEMMEAEQASISILNATKVPGLASETTMYLLDDGLNVVHTGNAEELTNTTTIIDYTGMPYTVQYLVNLFNIPESNIYSRYSPDAEVDITILLGDDWASNNSLP